jgi:hypothetical protein
VRGHGAGSVRGMKSFRSLVNTRSTLANSRLFTTPKITATTKFSTTTMPSYERVAIHRNPKYTHNGTKSYVFAMSKCESAIGVS